MKLGEQTNLIGIHKVARSLPQNVVDGSAGTSDCLAKRLLKHIKAGFGSV